MGAPGGNGGSSECGLKLGLKSVISVLIVLFLILEQALGCYIPRQLFVVIKKVWLLSLTPLCSPRGRIRCLLGLTLVLLVSLRTTDLSSWCLVELCRTRLTRLLTLRTVLTAHSLRRCYLLWLQMTISRGCSLDL